MEKHNEEKVKGMRDDIEAALFKYLYNENMQQLIVGDLETDDDGDVFITIDIAYRGQQLPVRQYCVWINNSDCGLRNPVYLTALIMADALKGIVAINEWWLRKQRIENGEEI